MRGLLVVALLSVYCADAANITYPTRPTWIKATGLAELNLATLASGLADTGALGALAAFTASTRATAGLDGIPISVINAQYQYFRTNSGIDINGLKTYGLKFGPGGGLGIPIIAGLGILCALLVPIIGLFFCCCRCCDHCGGKRVHKNPNETCYWIWTCISFFSIIMIFVGASVMFVANVQVESDMQTLNSTADALIDDAYTMLDNAAIEMANVVDNNVPPLLEYAREYIENFHTYIGDPLSEQIGAQINPGFALAREVLDDLGNITDILSNLNDTIADTGFLLDDLDTAITQLNSDMSSLQTSCTVSADCANLDAIAAAAFPLSLEVSSDDLPSVESELEQLRDVSSNSDFTDGLDQGEALINDFAGFVFNFTGDQRQMGLDILGTANSTVDQYYNEYRNIGYDFLNGSFDVRATKDEYAAKLDDPTVATYLQYKTWAFWALGGIGIFIGVLGLLSMMCGFCAHKSEQSPWERSNLSNHGGNTMMATIFFIVFFSLFLWILAVVFWTGGTAIGMVCGPVKSEAIIAGVADNPANFPGGKLPLTDLAYGSGSTVQYELQPVFDACRANQALLTATNLEVRFNLTELTDYNQYANVTELIEMVGGMVNLTEFTLLDDSARTGLLEIANITQIALDFSSYTSYLEGNVTSAELEELATQIAALDLSADGPGVEAQQAALVASLNNAYGTYVDPLLVLLSNATSYVDAIQTIAPPAGDKLIEVVDYFDNFTRYLAEESNDVIIEVLTELKDIVLADVDAYKAEILSYLRNDLLKCRFMTDMYDVATSTVCGPLQRTLDSLWFGLGAVGFFGLMLFIFGVKLAKHYHRMEEPLIENEKLDDVVQELSGYRDDTGKGGMVPSMMPGYSSGHDMYSVSSKNSHMVPNQHDPVYYDTGYQHQPVYGNSPADDLYQQPSYGNQFEPQPLMGNQSGFTDYSAYNGAAHAANGNHVRRRSSVALNAMHSDATLPPYMPEDEYKIAMDQNVNSGYF